MGDVGSITKVQKKLAEDGYEVSCYALRLWVKRGIIPAAYSGSKALISASSVNSVLENGMSGPLRANYAVR